MWRVGPQGEGEASRGWDADHWRPRPCRRAHARAAAWQLGPGRPRACARTRRAARGGGEATAEPRNRDHVSSTTSPRPTRSSSRSCDSRCRWPTVSSTRDSGRRWSRSRSSTGIIAFARVKLDSPGKSRTRMRSSRRPAISSLDSMRSAPACGSRGFRFPGLTKHPDAELFPDEGRARRERLAAATHALRERFGAAGVTRASLIPDPADPGDSRR